MLKRSSRGGLYNRLGHQERLRASASVQQPKKRKTTAKAIEFTFIKSPHGDDDEDGSITGEEETLKWNSVLTDGIIMASEDNSETEIRLSIRDSLRRKFPLIGQGDFVFVKVQHKKISVLELQPGAQYNYPVIKKMARQGMLYIRLKSSVNYILEQDGESSTDSVLLESALKVERSNTTRQNEEMRKEITVQEDSRKLIVYIGKAAGKHKYSLIDEEDIPMVKRFRFEARVDYEKNGKGAKVYAYAFDRLKEKHQGCYVHNYVWQRRCGGIAPGFKINHVNGVTVDNRLQNLELLPELDIRWEVARESDSQVDKQSVDSIEDTLYWKAISQIPAVNPDESLLHEQTKVCNADGDLLDADVEASFFYECHYTPCCRIEKEINDFRICGRCQEVRYCGPSCQQKDWPGHKPMCILKSKKKCKKTEKEAER
eukprot:gene16069-17692_t